MCGDKKRQATVIASALSLAVAGKRAEAIAAGAVSPYVKEVIKKATDSPEMQALNIPLHVLWGEVEAELAGGKAQTGAIAAGVGEVGAAVLAKSVYGKEASELTVEEKQTLLNASKALAGVASAATSANGNAASTLAETSIGMTVAENAVENNYLSQLSDNRRIWLREQLNRDDLSSVQREKYEQEFIQLEQDNHTSDILVAKAKYNPESMTQSDWELYQNYATRYYFESIRTEKPENVIADLDNILSNQYIKGYSYPYATAEKYRHELPSRWSLFGTNKSADEQFYTDIYSKYQNRKTYQESFDGRVAQSTAEALSYAGTMLSAGTVASVASKVGKFTSNGINKASSAIGTFATKYPKAAEGIVVGSISTGFDLYNGDASPEKTAMNYILGRGLAGKSWDKQLSVNAIYKGVISVNENRSDKDIVLGQVSNAIALGSGESVEGLLNLVGQKGISKQIISNIVSGYVENKIDNRSKDSKEIRKEGDK
ncbi:VENN motif pre-toxin domain-containing protein [[Mannheimia] succiniciproducens]|uniref:VENN motif-containing domain-containing protein n=1 Tax=Mannheimia succiniciproducens (strain KCTC 0769BP / MBEL55E) TaxID=221988 RepID=Q65TD9_MANSM|nr:VENN motif pre-toxin domain-containing protein [[Mannheimia] succiniciproducens]AAU37771.1 unknown [[Mannheimia] succiniciproducens MBEL55E]